MGKKAKTSKTRKKRQPVAAEAAVADQGGQAFAQACELHQRGDLAAAEAGYRQTVALDPGCAEAWRNLGALLRGRGEFAQGRHCTEQALKLNATDGSLWGNYGNVLRDLGLFDESARAFQEGLRRQPGSLGLLQGLAITLGRQGEHQRVVELLSPLVEQGVPAGGSNALADLLLELGNAHHALDQQQLALQRWQQGAHSAEGEKRLFIGLNTAQVLCGQKRYAEATSICQSLEPLFPNNANLTYAQGVIAKGLGRLDEAVRLFERALELEPAYPICLNTFGLLLREIGRTHQARDCFERALQHQSDFGPAMNNLGSVLKDVARYDEALVWLRRGSQAMADNPAAHSNVLFTLVGYELEPAEQRFAEARRFAERFGTSPFERWRDGIPDPRPERVLKLGLVSPDFCRHAVSYFIEPLLEQWDRRQLEVTLYSCGEQHDDYTARLQEKAEHWRDLRGQSDENCIAQIQRDEIDILVDLAGHTAGNRLALFAAKPAPIQATYQGYYGTTGLSQVDYWLTDPVLHPPERDADDPASEQRWRLGRCYVSYRPSATAPPVAPPPCLRTGWITFGSFNQSRKITHRTAAHWLAVLNAVPGSRLLLKSKNLGEEVEQQRVRELFAALGLAPERLDLRGHSPTIEAHLASYADVDIALDTFPYTGCTTTADALWMGVPVLTVAGSSMVSRQAAAVLAGVGRADWICADGADMAARAAALAADPQALHSLRLQQRPRVAASPLLDHADLARATERAFRQWWHTWLAQQGWSGGGAAAWPQLAPVAQPPMPLANGTARRLPLWLGPMAPEQRQHWQASGHELVAVDDLSPWGGLAEQFRAQERGRRLLVHLAAGDADGRQRRWWQRVYPQLCWDVQRP
ncbi:MAG: tetratricopeptide repeat protein [Cyanobacteriota bacterium]|nr:tetratricopeptide repeat protein [Cyanobacteriota bacterium]